MGFDLSSSAECETVGNWRLVRRTLGLKSFGVNLVQIPPGEQIPEHDELDRNQEEIFYAIEGSPSIVIDGQEHPLPAGAFARLDPEHKRTVRNDGGVTANVLIASAPRTSGYEPMEWA